MCWGCKRLGHGSAWIQNQECVDAKGRGQKAGGVHKGGSPKTGK